MKKTNRRDFIKKSTAAVTAVGFTPYLLSSVQPARAESANDRLQIGGIGVGGMGRGDLSEFTALGDVVAVCDVDANHVLAAQNHG
ncbi:MAG: twin-arginine translocation signal domain-containing protein, partial [Thermoguttaceae bacterium]